MPKLRCPLCERPNETQGACDACRDTVLNGAPEQMPAAAPPEERWLRVTHQASGISLAGMARDDETLIQAHARLRDELGSGISRVQMQLTIMHQADAIAVLMRDHKGIRAAMADIMRTVVREEIQAYDRACGTPRPITVVQEPIVSREERGSFSAVLARAVLRVRGKKLNAR